MSLVDPVIPEDAPTVPPESKTPRPTVVYIPPMPEQPWICDKLGYNSCIKFEPEKVNWMDAAASCAYQQANLVKIYDMAYLQWVDSVRKGVQLADDPLRAPYYDNFWTFYNDKTTEAFDVRDIASWDNDVDPNETLESTTQPTPTEPEPSPLPNARAFADEVKFNGSFSGFHNWQELQPDNDNNQDCVVINKDNYYNDFWCNSKVPYICQKLPPPVFHHIYRQKAPDLFNITELKIGCTGASCDFEIIDPISGDLSSWLNFDLLKQIKTRPFHFKMLWDNGAFITWSQFQHPLKAADEIIFEKQIDTYGVDSFHVTYHPAEGDNLFKSCDGIAFDGLTTSTRTDTMFDGSSSFENYYPVGVGGSMWHGGYRHAVTFPYYGETVLGGDTEVSCSQEKEAAYSVLTSGRDEDPKAQPTFNGRTSKRPTGRRYPSVDNSVSEIDLWVSEEEFPWRSAYKCDGKFDMTRDGVSMAGYQCLIPLPITTPAPTIPTTIYTTEATTQNVGDSAMEGALAGSIGGAIGGTILANYAPKVIEWAQPKLTPALIWLKNKIFGGPIMEPFSQQYDFKPKRPKKMKQTQYKDPNLVYERKNRELVQQINTSEKSTLFGLLHTPSEVELKEWQEGKEKARLEREIQRELDQKKKADRLRKEDEFIEKTLAADRATRDAKNGITSQLSGVTDVIKEAVADPVVDSVTTIVESFAAKTEQPKPTDNTPPADEEDEWHDDNGFINHDELARMLDTVYFLADLDKASDTVRMEILHELNGDLHDEADMLLASMANMAKGLHETSFDSCDEDDGDNEEDSDSEDESVDNVLDALYLKYEDREFVRMVDREMATDTPLDAAMKTVEGVMSAVGVIAGAAGVVALNGKLAEQKEKLLDGAKDQLASGIKKVEQTGNAYKDGLMQKAKSCGACEQLNAQLNALVPQQYRSQLESVIGGASGGITFGAIVGLFNKPGTRTIQMQVSFNPTVGIQTAPLYVVDHTLFRVESTQTTDDLKNHTKPDAKSEPEKVTPKAEEVTPKTEVVTPRAKPRTKSKRITRTKSIKTIKPMDV